jgi:hypothetical protein
MAYSVSNLLQNCKYNSFDKFSPNPLFIRVNTIFATNKTVEGYLNIFMVLEQKKFQVPRQEDGGQTGLEAPNSNTQITNGSTVSPP